MLNPKTVVINAVQWQNYFYYSEQYYGFHFNIYPLYIKIGQRKGEDGTFYDDFFPQLLLWLSLPVVGLKFYQYRWLLWSFPAKALSK